MTCTLCNSKTEPYHTWNSINVFACPTCKALLKDTACFPSLNEEKERYDTHNNDVHDIGYQKFVSPIVNQIKKDFSNQHKGLDYGCGPGPVITHLLQQELYAVQIYDPIYAPDLSYLEQSFDFIICCEVAEHFHDPQKEFGRLKSLLRPGGNLYCMTSLFYAEMDFENWYYKNDNTHVIFYMPETFEWIQKNFEFSKLSITGSMIVLGN